MQRTRCESGRSWTSCLGPGSRNSKIAFKEKDTKHRRKGNLFFFSHVGLGLSGFWGEGSTSRGVVIDLDFVHLSIGNFSDSVERRPRMSGSRALDLPLTPVNLSKVLSSSRTEREYSFLCHSRR